MDRVYSRADEKLVKTTTIYGKGADNYVYADADYKVKISKEDLIRLCLVGATVLYGGKYYNVLTFGADESNAHASITIYDGSTTAITLYSTEYSAE